MDKSHPIDIKHIVLQCTLTSEISQSSEDFWRQILRHTLEHSSQTKLGSVRQQLVNSPCWPITY